MIYGDPRDGWPDAPFGVAVLAGALAQVTRPAIYVAVILKTLGATRRAS